MRPRRPKLTAAEKWKRRRNARRRAELRRLAFRARAELFRANVARFGQSGTSVAVFDATRRTR